MVSSLTPSVPAARPAKRQPKKVAARLAEKIGRTHFASQRQHFAGAIAYKSVSLRAEKNALIPLGAQSAGKSR